MDYQKYLESEHWQKKREEALINNSFRCRICKSEENLNVHHLNYDNLGNESLDDLIVLCKNCHSRWHKIDKYFSVEKTDFHSNTNSILNKTKNKVYSPDGIPTGFKHLDDLTSGFHQMDLIVIASRPSMGKTSFALNVARNIAIDYNIPVGFFSLETNKDQLILRLLCSEAKINQLSARTGRLSKDESKRLQIYSEKLQRAPIYFGDEFFDIYDILTKAFYLKKKKNIEILFIDYFQLINIKDTSNIYQEMDFNLRFLKNLSVELKIPVVLLSQVSRSVETRERSKRPSLSDLRGSGSIEEIADLILFLYSPEYYGILEFEDTGESTYNMCEVIIGKQRNGPIGNFRLTFLKEFGKFMDPYICNGF